MLEFASSEARRGAALTLGAFRRRQAVNSPSAGTRAQLADKSQISLNVCSSAAENPGGGLTSQSHFSPPDTRSQTGPGWRCLDRLFRLFEVCSSTFRLMLAVCRLFWLNPGVSVSLARCHFFTKLDFFVNTQDNVLSFTCFLTRMS